MPNDVRSWLPEMALEGSVADRGVADAARQWSAKWFANAAVQPRGGFAVDATGDLANVEWLVLDDDIAVAVPASSRLALAVLMTGAPADAGIAGATDGRVVDELARTCVDDLLRRLIQLFRLPDGARWARCAAGERPTIAAPRGCDLFDGDGSPLLRILVATELLIEFVKAGLPPLPKQAPLAPLSAGLAAQRVAVSAFVGRCRLTLADIAGLGPGDVVVLDRDAGSAVELAVDGAPTLDARCSVEQADGRLSLTLLEDIPGQAT